MKLQQLRDSLVSTGIPTHHFSADTTNEKYIVWAEEGQAKSGNADNKTIMQIIRGTVEYYTKEEFDPNFDIIQNKLNSIDIAWELEDIQFYPETDYIRYLWTWEMENSLEEVTK